MRTTSGPVSLVSRTASAPVPASPATNERSLGLVSRSVSRSADNPRGEHDAPRRGVRRCTLPPIGEAIAVARPGPGLAEGGVRDPGNSIPPPAAPRPSTPPAAMRRPCSVRCWPTPFPGPGLRLADPAGSRLAGTTRLRTFFASVNRGYLRRGKPCYSPVTPRPLHSGPRRAPERCRSASHPGGGAQRLALRSRLFHALRTQMQSNACTPGSPAALVPRLPRHPPRPAGQGLGTQRMPKILAGADSVACGLPRILLGTQACRCISAMASTSSANYRP